MQKPRYKKGEDGTVIFTDVETRPPRGAPVGADFVVLSVRIRYRFTQRLIEAEWQNVRKQFKATYPVGRRRAENDVAIHMQFKIDGVPHLLQLNSEGYRDGNVSRYSITIY